MLLFIRQQMEQKHVYDMNIYTFKHGAHMNYYSSNE